MLNRAYDPFTLDTESALLSHMLAIGQWSVEGTMQAEPMMRELQVRIDALDKRTGKRVSPDVEALICTLVYQKFDLNLKERIEREGGRTNLLKMRESVEKQ